MCETKLSLRYQSFNDIFADLSSSLFSQINFSDNDKKKYKEFADCLISAISVFESYPILESDPNPIIEKLGNVIKNNALEDKIMGNYNLISCFLNKNDMFRYYPSTIIPMNIVNNFYKLLINSNEEDKKLIISNINNRLNTIKVKISPNIYLPF